jgi:hypothetical protein
MTIADSDANGERPLVESMAVAIGMPGSRPRVREPLSSSTIEDEKLRSIFIILTLYRFQKVLRFRAWRSVIAQEKMLEIE